MNEDQLENASSTSLAAALANCASEPIRVPGAIQPHGVLLTARGTPLCIEQISLNCLEYFGQPAELLIGRPLTELLTAEQVDALTLAALRLRQFSEVDPLRLRIGAMDFSASLHYIEDLVVIEFEPFVELAQDQSRIISRVLRNLQAASTLAALYEISVHEIQALTGYDRVMIYRFENEGHGKVVAEALTGLLPSYWGLNFPGSDIPAQARELYRLNWLRVIPDATYVPVPLLPALRPDNGEPLDLGFSMLRSVSPVHCEYLKNMGVRSSMSISLLENEELWGLIACGHPTPLKVSLEIRAACALIGQMLSVKIAAIVALQTQREREEKISALSHLTHGMKRAQEIFDGLISQSADLQSLVNAQGVAVLVEHRLHLFGICPAAEEVHALHIWIRDLGLARQNLRKRPQGLQGVGVFHSDCMQSQYPASAEFREIASGVLAFILPKPVDNAVIWFRPQLSSSMNWSGDPKHHVTLGEVGSASHRLHPRQSFDVWEEQVQGLAQPWSMADLYAAEDLRRSALENDLERQVRREQEAVRLRDELVAVVSHDLRNPMSIIIMQCSIMQQWAVSQDSPEKQRLSRALGTIEMATSRMNSLLEDLLDTAKIDAGRYQLACVPLEVGNLLEEACALLVTLTAHKNIELNCTAQAGLEVFADPERIFQVLSNLLGNAIKFTAEGGRIDIDASHDGHRVVFKIKDNGIGITAEQMPHIFQRYWSVKKDNPRGNGLGLYISRAIIEAHGGHLWAESEPGAGSVFTFTLPFADATQQPADASHPVESTAVRPLPIMGSFPMLLGDKSEDTTRKALLNELNHRVKNTLATVQAIATLTARNSDSIAAFQISFEARLLALSRAHDALAQREWVATRLFDLLSQAREPFGGAARVTILGDDVALEPRISLTLSMVIHELMTNAVQHGALGLADGKVLITSTLNAADNPTTLKIEWTERAGPAVTQSPTQGFGTRLIHRSIERELGGIAHLTFLQEGLQCCLLIPWSANPAQLS